MRIRMIFASLFFFLMSICLAAKEADHIEVSDYSFIKDNLYEKGGKLFFQSKRVGVGDGLTSEVIYIKRFGQYDQDNEIVWPLLSDLIDEKSWEKISPFFYRDNNHLYCFTHSADGGYLNYLEGVDPNKLMVSGHLGWRNIGEWAKSFGVTDGCAKKRYTGWYSSDGLRVFYRCTELRSADFNSFKLILDDNSDWDAEDKFFFL